MGFFPLFIVIGTFVANMFTKMSMSKITLKSVLPFPFVFFGFTWDVNFSFTDYREGQIAFLIIGGLIASGKRR